MVVSEQLYHLLVVYLEQIKLSPRSLIYKMGTAALLCRVIGKSQCNK